MKCYMNKVLLKTIYCCLLLPYYIFSQSSAKNFVRETIYKSGSGSISNPNLMQSTITYLDGLGRPTQTVAVHAGGQGQDLVSHITYDALGRESKKYLPYPLVGGKGEYQSNAPVSAASNLGDANPYNITIYEASPLNRIVKQGGPGADWKISESANKLDDHSIKVKYSTNTDNEVKLFEAFNASGNKLDNSWHIAGGLIFVGYYAANQLWVTETLDENNTTEAGGNRIREYKDKLGRIVMKRVFVSESKKLDTYYVYDDWGQLRAVFPPLLSSNLTTFNGTEFTSTDLTNVTELAFLYCYDDQGHMTQKKVPGSDYVSMTYNEKDLLITSQDGNQRNAGISAYINYDDLNRVKSTGVGTEWLTKTYYDGLGEDGLEDASWLNTTNSASDYANIDLTVKKGLVTGGQTRVIKADGTYVATGLSNRVYYDSRGRTVKSYKEYYAVGSSPFETVCLKRSYTGTVLEEQTVQGNSLGTLTLTKSLQYDHADRLRSICHRIVEVISSKTREEVPHLLNNLHYDGLGRLDRKSMGRMPAKYLKSNPNSEFAETQYFKYNIRNWLTESSAYRLVDKTAYDNAPSAEKLNFNVKLEYATSKQYNGNIEKYSWNGGSYGLLYDGANRLLSAIDESKQAYYDEELSYDDNGNISTLKRSRHVNTSTTDIADNLTYTYSNSGKGNRLLKVADSELLNVGYADVNSTGDDFSYDNNGNLTQDKDKGIETISYNVLNLVRQVSGVTSGTSKAKGVVQSYVWDGTGNKLSYISTGTGTVKKTYVGAVEYTTNENNDLVPNRIATEEGHVLKREGWTEESTKSKYVYYYAIKDHLGNVRVVIDDEQDAQLWQSNSYSAFGLLVPGTVTGISAESSAKANDRYYNGKEAQDVVGWYDFGARMYNPEIGRWMTVDPMTENQEQWSPFHYTYDNPVRFTDPDGREPCCGGAMNFVMGFTHAFNEDVSPIPGTNLVNPNGGRTYSDGAALGHRAALIVGLLEVGAGITGDAAAVVSEVVTVGGATPVAVPLAAVSTGAIVHGASTVAKAAYNLNSGRGKNHLGPDNTAKGDHSTFRKDPQTGKITNTATYKQNPKNPKGFDETKRVDVTGSSHRHSKTGKEISTPHVHDKGQKDPRPPKPNELPNQ